MSAVSKNSDPANEDDCMSAVYALLAGLLSREIDQNLLELLRVPPVKELLFQVEPEIAALFNEPWTPARQEAYAVEFCRLFIYPGVCHPHADAWVEGAADNQFSIHRWFESESQDIGLPVQFAELSATHVAKILIVRAGLRGVSPEKIEAFELEMIRPWCGKFAAHLSSVAGTPIYRAVAAILTALV